MILIYKKEWNTQYMLQHGKVLKNIYDKWKKPEEYYMVPDPTYMK